MNNPKVTSLLLILRLNYIALSLTIFAYFGEFIQQQTVAYWKYESILSKLVDQNNYIYWQIKNTFGTGFANFLLGQLSDLMSPILGGLIILIILAIVWWLAEGILPSENMDRLASTFIQGCLLMSVVNLYDEFTDIAVNCNLSAGVCQTDGFDLLVFSVPIISFLIYILYIRLKVLIGWN